jgi:betaine-aldehyde dehydrogenase
VTVRIGGQRIDRPGWFYAPTVVTDADQSDEISNAGSSGR